MSLILAFSSQLALASPASTPLATPLSIQSPSKIEHLGWILDRFLQQITIAHEPGLVALAIKDGHTLFEKGFGVRDTESQTPISAETVFQLASTSKQFTAFAIAILIKQKKLKLSDKINSILTELPAYTSKIKLEHLVYHTSGLPDYYLESDICFSTRPNTNDDVILFVKSQKKLRFKSGTRFDYSNTGYVLLAEIIKRVSGQSFSHFMSQNIFSPLGMRSTFTADLSPQQEHQKTKSYYTEDGLQKSYPNTSCDQIVGDGGVFSSLTDMKKWIQNIQEGLLLPKETMTNLIHRKGTFTSGLPVDYGFGWFIESTSSGEDYIHHGGGWLGFHHSFDYYPSQNLWILILSNHVDYGPPARTTISARVLEIINDTLK